MKLTKEQVENFHCPRWEELPTLPLYMDQVLMILEEALQLFLEQSEKGKDRVVTPTMINNYVKQKLISPPEKKKYHREHIALLIMVSILKKALSMAEITGVITLMIEDGGIQSAYDLFCDKLERALRSSCIDSEEQKFFYEDTTMPPALRASLIALVGKLMVQDCLPLPEEALPALKKAAPARHTKYSD